MAELLPLDEAVRELVRDGDTTTLVSELRRRGGYGLAALCIGVGQGIAMVVEADGAK